MNSVFLLSGKTLCVRRLKEDDLQYSYYEVMNLLSQADRTILQSRDMTYILDNEHIYFVVEDISIRMIVGVCSLVINNDISDLCKIGVIENIMLRDDYKNIGLYDIIFKKVQDYCLSVKHCLKIIVKCSSEI